MKVDSLRMKKIIASVAGGIVVVMAVVLVVRFAVRSGKRHQPSTQEGHLASEASIASAGLTIRAPLRAS